MDQLKNIVRGDTIGICAPAARFNNRDFQSGVQILEDNGFEVVIPTQIHEEKRYLAGEDRRRADTVMSLFTNTNIDCILCARGGFGVLRILDHLDWNVIRRNPKPFVGFSDITALLLMLSQKANLPVIHGPNITSLPTASEETLHSLFSILNGELNQIKMNKASVICQGKSKGNLLGGNLATISHLLGTPFQPDFDNCVLFLEDRGEPAYKIDRMLSQMKMAGLFENINGVLTGIFKDCNNQEYIPRYWRRHFHSTTFLLSAAWNPGTTYRICLCIWGVPLN